MTRTKVIKVTASFLIVVLAILIAYFGYKAYAYHYPASQVDFKVFTSSDPKYETTDLKLILGYGPPFKKDWLSKPHFIKFEGKTDSGSTEIIQYKSSSNLKLSTILCTNCEIRSTKRGVNFIYEQVTTENIKIMLEKDGTEFIIWSTAHDLDYAELIDSLKETELKNIPYERISLPTP